MITCDKCGIEKSLDPKVRVATYSFESVGGKGAELCDSCDAKLKALKDCHRGRRAVIVGNGPSLNVADLERLKDEITFASNKIYLALRPPLVL